MPAAPKFDAFALIRAAANSDWTRPVLCALATPHFAYFTTLWVSLSWLGVCLALEALFLRARRRALAGRARWRTVLMATVLALPWPWMIYSIILWEHGTPAAQAAALCALFTSAVVAASNPQNDRRVLVGNLAPPVLAACAMLAAAYIKALPGEILPFALCSALGIAVTMFGAAEASYTANQRMRQMRAELKVERDALERRVRERTADLELAMRQAQAASLAKSQFLAKMSHELRTPLNAVIGYAEMLADDLADTGAETAAKDARKIGRAGRHLLGLVDDVLDLAHMDSGQLTLNVAPADVGGLLNGAAEEARALLQARGLQFDVDIQRMPAMACDGPRLKRAVAHLLSNAVKFTQRGSVLLTARLEDEWLVVRVIDTGIGIAPDQLATLFQPFQQADNSTTRKFDGAGLGLIMTRNLARLMGGDVQVESALGQGSAFTLRIPRREMGRASRAVA